jgi:hypothetical protein
MAKHHKKATGIKNPLPRKVHLGEDVWTYTVGHGRFRADEGAQALIIRSPDGKITKEFDLAEVTKEELTPSVVKEFLMDRFGGSLTAFKDYHGS